MPQNNAAPQDASVEQDTPSYCLELNTIVTIINLIRLSPQDQQDFTLAIEALKAVEERYKASKDNNQQFEETLYETLSTTILAKGTQEKSKPLIEESLKYANKAIDCDSRLPTAYHNKVQALILLNRDLENASNVLNVIIQNWFVGSLYKVIEKFYTPNNAAKFLLNLLQGKASIATNLGYSDDAKLWMKCADSIVTSFQTNNLPNTVGTLRNFLEALDARDKGFSNPFDAQWLTNLGLHSIHTISADAPSTEGNLDLIGDDAKQGEEEC